MSVKWEGLNELQAQLRTLPEDLTADATAIVYGAADGAAQEIIAAYPRVTGDTRKGVKVKRSGGPTRTSATVSNSAPLAFIIENGTQTRQYVTKNGVKHVTGRMPPLHVFGRIAPRRRRAMYEALKALLVTHGAQVSGDAG